MTTNVPCSLNETPTKPTRDVLVMPVSVCMAMYASPCREPNKCYIGEAESWKHFCVYCMRVYDVMLHR